jgi:hypothetical protein
MGAGCAMLASTAVTAARGLLAAVHPRWVRRATVVLVLAGVLVSTVGLRSSGGDAHRHGAPAPALAPPSAR